MGLGKSLREDLHVKRKRVFPLKLNLVWRQGKPEDGIYQNVEFGLWGKSGDLAWLGTC